MLVLLAMGAADSPDRTQLLLGGGDVTLDDIGLAEILPDLSVARVLRNRLQIVAYPLINPTQLARRIASVIERFSRIRVAEHVERLERLVVAPGLGQRVGILRQCLVRQNTTLPLDTSPGLRIPDFTSLAVGIGCSSAAASIG